MDQAKTQIQMRSSSQCHPSAIAMPRQVEQGNQDLKAQMELQGTQVLQVETGNLARRDHQDHQVLPAVQENKDPKDHREKQECKKKEAQDQQVKQADQELQAHQDQLVAREARAKMASLVGQVKQEM